MPNLLEMLRLQNVFGTPDMIGTPSAGNVMDPSYDASFETPPVNMDEIYQPEHAMIDRMNQMVNEMPQRNNPSTLQKVFASLAGGAGGPDAADRFAYGPFYRQMEDWQNQFRPVAAAANQERYYNSNLRQLATSVANQNRLERDLARKERKDAGDQAIAESKLEIQRKRADAYDFKTRHPDWQAAKTKGGTLMYVNPKDPSQIVDTGIELGTMTDYDKYTLLGGQRMEQIGAQQAGATERTGMVVAGADERNEESIAAANERARLAQEGADRRNTERINAPGKTGTKTRSQADVEKEIANRARQIKAQHPEWSSYIEFDKSNRFKGITAPGLIFGPNQQTHDAIYNAIYGGGPTKSNAPGYNAGTPQQNMPPEGWLKVRRKSDGQTGKILLKDYDPKKYDKVIP